MHFSSVHTTPVSRATSRRQRTGGDLPREGAGGGGTGGAPVPASSEAVDDGGGDGSPRSSTNCAVYSLLAEVVRRLRLSSSERAGPAARDTASHSPAPKMEDAFMRTA